MQQPLRITFHGIEPSEFVERRIRESAAELERFSDQIVSCHVTVDAPHQRHHKGNIYAVRINVRLPDEHVVVGKQRHENHAHDDVYVAIRDAFGAAARQLEDYMRTRRGQVKQHDVPDHGKVVKVERARGYGFVETADHVEVYFHQNSVTDGKFGELEPGDEVRITLAPSESKKGPQASSVTPIGKHHVVGP